MVKLRDSMDEGQCKKKDPIEITDREMDVRNRTNSFFRVFEVRTDAREMDSAKSFTSINRDIVIL